MRRRKMLTYLAAAAWAVADEIRNRFVDRVFDKVTNLLENRPAEPRTVLIECHMRLRPLTMRADLIVTRGSG